MQPLWIRARIHRAWAMTTEGQLVEYADADIASSVVMVPTNVTLYSSPQGLVRYVDAAGRQLIELTETMDELEARLWGTGMIQAGAVPISPTRKNTIVPFPK